MSDEKIYPSMVIRSQAEAIELLEQENQRLKENWNELKEWLLCMQEVSHLDLKCLQSVLSKMQEIESGKNDRNN